MPEIIRIDNQDNAVQEVVTVDQVRTVDTQQSAIAPAAVFQQDNKKDDDKSQVDTVVDQLFSAAVVHAVQNDQEVRDKIVDTAKQVVTDKTDVIKHKAKKESTEAYFDANEAACTIFGYDEKTTSKSHVKIMKFWAYVLNTIYIFTIGFFVVSPIVFISKKLRVVIKHTWLTVLIGILIYLAIIGVPVLVSWLTGLSQ